MQLAQVGSIKSTSHDHVKSLPHIIVYPVDISGTVTGESPNCLLLSGTVVGENPDHVCWVHYIYNKILESRHMVYIL